MTVRTMKEGVFGCAEALGRKTASVFISIGPDGDEKNIGAIHTGSPNAVRVPNGFILSMGLTRERLKELRDACNELLSMSEDPS